MDYTKHLSEPWLSLIKLKKKTVEGRLCKGEFASMKHGDKIKFTNNDFGIQRSFTVKVVKTVLYESLNDYLEGEKLDKCLPGIDNISNGIKICRSYYTYEQERMSGIVAIRMRLDDK